MASMVQCGNRATGGLMSTPTPFVQSIIIDQVIDALAAFLTPFAGGLPIIRARVNRVPPPITGYIELNEIQTVDLETPSTKYVQANAQLNVITPKRIDIQVDFYGPLAGDQCNAVKTVMRSIYAPLQFPDGIKPLYCTDGQQSPLITCSLQYNPVVSLPQLSANKLAININKDVTQL
jgi:hypothetical protein